MLRVAGGRSNALAPLIGGADSPKVLNADVVLVEGTIKMRKLGAEAPRAMAADAPRYKGP
jgi:hypothetical protein